MCGRPDAKKWKVSFWRTDAEGEPIETLHDWLSRLKLDRKALDALARNWFAYDAYDRRIRHTGRRRFREVVVALICRSICKELLRFLLVSNQMIIVNDVSIVLLEKSNNSVKNVSE